MKPSIVLIGLSLLTACGGGSPTSPTAPQLPNADLAARSGLTIEACAQPGCAYEFQFENRGPGCAKAVKGTVQLVNTIGTVIASDSWTLDPARVVHAGEMIDVHDCCFLEPDTMNAAQAPVTFQSEAVACE